jgi:hypothetical protein
MGCGANVWSHRGAIDGQLCDLELIRALYYIVYCLIVYSILYNMFYPVFYNRI